MSWYHMQKSNNYQIGRRNVCSELSDEMKNAEDFTGKYWWRMKRRKVKKAQEAYFPWSNGVKVCEIHSKVVHLDLRGTKLRLRRVSDRSKCHSWYVAKVRHATDLLTPRLKHLYSEKWKRQSFCKWNQLPFVTQSLMIFWIIPCQSGWVVLALHSLTDPATLASVRPWVSGYELCLIIQQDKKYSQSA